MTHEEFLQMLRRALVTELDGEYQFTAWFDVALERRLADGVYNYLHDRLDAVEVQQADLAARLAVVEGALLEYNRPKGKSFAAQANLVQVMNPAVLLAEVKASTARLIEGHPANSIACKDNGDYVVDLAGLVKVQMKDEKRPVSVLRKTLLSTRHVSAVLKEEGRRLLGWDSYRRTAVRILGAYRHGVYEEGV